MKKVFAIVSLAVLLVGCATKKTENKVGYEVPAPSDVVMYQVNPRVFAANNSFAEVSKHLDEIQALGTNVVWVMPIYPIGQVKSKNSPYSISDYCAVNPEFGTFEDFKALVDGCHQRGMAFIMDWVANHTAWDAKWILEGHTDWYTTNADGAIVFPEGTDWTDVADLNYDNKDMRAEMIKSMLYWVENAGVDGFRCDVADFVPADFWRECISTLREKAGRNLLFLAEGNSPDNFSSGFDMNYAWDYMPVLRQVYGENLSAKSLIEADAAEYAKIPFGKVKLRFTTNHDEATKKSTVDEFGGKQGALSAWVAAVFMNGAALVYGEQEVAYPNTINFFNHVPVDFSANPDVREAYTALIKVFKENPRIHKGPYKSHSTDDVLILEKDNYLVMVNTRPEARTVQMPAGWSDATDLLKNEGLKTGADYTLPEYGYLLLRKPAYIAHVEPPSWWSGMTTNLQILVNGPGIGDYTASVEGLKGVKIKEVHKAESNNYLFLDMDIKPGVEGTANLVFKGDDQTLTYPYVIGKKDTKARESFSTADMIYLIFPDRFSNGDLTNDTVEGCRQGVQKDVPLGRHGGDLQGVINKLDYIKNLGATAIWLTPVTEDDQDFESYHGYAVTNHYKIDPRFGTNELYKEMVAKAHEKGIKVINDIVTNHCGTFHWFMSDLPFADWIHQFPEYTKTNIDFSANFDPNASLYDLNIQESGWFVPMMPDMNLDNPYTLQYLKQWAIWWVEYAGLDGIRVDTYPYNEKNPMSDWCKAVLAEYPWINIVGECWISTHDQLAYWQGGNENKDGFDSNLPSIMDFPLEEAIVAALCEGGDNPEWGHGMVRVYDCLSHDAVYHDLSKMMIFLANHDHGRLGDTFNQDPTKMKMALAMLATMRGIPQLYNGDEMFFSKAPGSDWSDGAKRVDFPEDLFQKAELGSSTPDNGEILGDVVRGGQPSSTIAPNATDIYEYTVKLFNWRKGKSVIHNGKTMHFLSRDNTYGYFRYNDEDTVFVFVNNTNQPQRVPWDHYAEITTGLGTATNVITGETFDPADYSVPAKTAVIAEF